MRCLVLVVLSFHLASRAEAQEVPDAKTGQAKGPLSQNGELNNLTQDFARIFSFTYSQGKVLIDRGKWGDSSIRRPFGGFAQNANQPSSPLEDHFASLMNKGQIRSISTSSGGTRRFMKFQGAKLNGEMTIELKSISLSVSEATEPKRTLTLTDEGTGFRILLSHSSGASLEVKQDSQGPFGMTFVLEKERVESRSASLKDFFRNHRSNADTSLFPYLEPLGIRLLQSPNAPNVRRVVLSEICRTPQDAEKAERLCEELDNADFRVREAARKQLFDRFDFYREVITKKIASPNLPLETSRRLTAIRDRFLDSERAHELADILELLKDVPYVVSLLETARAEDVPQVIRRLEAMTGENLGPDPAAWQSWIAKTKR